MSSIKRRLRNLKKQFKRITKIIDSIDDNNPHKMDLILKLSNYKSIWKDIK